MLLSIITKLLENQYTWNLAILILAAGILLIVRQLLNNKINSIVFWSLFIVLFFLIRSYDFFQLWTMNQDEEQWILCARSMAHEPGTWFRYFMVFDYTRFFTVLPLAVLVLITQGAGYIQARIMQIFLTLFFLYISQKALSRWFDKRTSWSASLMFAIFTGMSRNADIIAYNSELFASVLYMLFLWQLIRIQQSDAGKYGWFWAGIILGLIPFAKEQSVLIALLSGITVFVFLAAVRDYKNAISIALGGIAGFLIVFIPVVLINGFELVSGLFGIALQYSEQGLELSPTGENPKSALVFLKSFFLNKEYFPFTVFLVLSLIPFYQMFRSVDKKEVLFNSVILVGFTAALYSIYKPGNNFFHYSLLNWPFIVFLTAMAIHSFPLFKKYYWAGALLVIISQVHDLKFRQFYPLHTLANRQDIPLDIVQQKINEFSKPGDRVLVWGWSNKYYVIPERERGGGYLYPKFAVGNYKGRQLALDIYENDLKHFKPQIIIEAIGEDQFDFKDYETQSIAATSASLSAILFSEYNQVFNEGSYRIYSRINSQ